MGQLQTELIHRARERFGDICCCGRRQDLSECFTIAAGKLILWYNSPDGSTHVEVAGVTDQERVAR